MKDKLSLKVDGPQFFMSQFYGIKFQYFLNYGICEENVQRIHTIQMLMN